MFIIVNQRLDNPFFNISWEIMQYNGEASLWNIRGPRQRNASDLSCPPLVLGLLSDWFWSYG